MNCPGEMSEREKYPGEISGGNILNPPRRGDEDSESY